MEKSIASIFMFSVFLVVVVSTTRLMLLQTSAQADAAAEFRERQEERTRTGIAITSTLAPIVFRCETKVEATLENVGKVTIGDFPHADVVLDYVSTASSTVAHRFDYVVGNVLRDEWTFSSTTSDTTQPTEWPSEDLAYLTSRLTTQPKQGTWGYLTVSTPNGIAGSAYVDFTNAVSADCRYLHNNPTPPVANTVSQAVLPMDGQLPTAPFLYDYSTDRNGPAGLRVDKSSAGLGELDPTKFQVWQSGPLPVDLPITGTVLIDMWAAIEDYTTGLVGAITVFLRDYDPTGPSHTEITDGTVFADDWQTGSGDFVEKMALVLGTNDMILAGHELEVWVVVDNLSGQAMWLAYDTDDRPSVINLTYVPPATSSLLYFHNNPTPPVGDTARQAELPVTPTAPGATVLFDYDGDGIAGLGINASALGLTEPDPAKFQVWRTNVLDTDWLLKGDILIDMWMSMKDFTQSARGVTTLYLRDFDNLSSHTEIANGSLFDIDWQRGSGTWVKKTILVPGIDYTIPAGHRLEARLMVDNESSDAMWIAYDTTAQPTVMNFPLDTAVPDFQTVATLTVLDGWDEKNSDTLVNLGLVSQVQTSDDVRLITEPPLPPALYTSFQFTNVAIPANATIT